jgi:glycosyltransferase involved in cell wall biosynthesis
VGQHGPVRVAYTVEQCWHQVPGGTAVAALGLARELRQRTQLDLLGVSARHRSMPEPPFEPPIPVRQLPLPRRALYEAWRRIGWPPVQRATGPVDMVHATTIIVPPPGGAPMVVTLHDLAFLHDPGSFTSHGVKAFEAGLERIRRDAALVLCSSQATFDDCAAAGLDADRLRVVHLGLDPVDRPSSTEVEAVRQRLGLARPYVLFVGTLEPRKNLPRLLEAFGSLDTGHELVLVGPLGWGGEDARGQTGGSGEVPGVRVLGFVDEATKAALYEGADVVCYPSLREGFGLPVLEGMAHGAPVVTSRGTATAEVGGEAVVLVDPLDPADIARGMTEALDRRAELARAGPARAACFTWAAAADAVVAAYREVAP